MGPIIKSQNRIERIEWKEPKQMIPFDIFFKKQTGEKEHWHTAQSHIDHILAIEVDGRKGSRTETKKTVLILFSCLKIPCDWHIHCECEKLCV